MGSPPLDFESSASTYFTTPAKLTQYTTLKRSKVKFFLSAEIPDFSNYLVSFAVFTAE